MAFEAPGPLVAPVASVVSGREACKHDGGSRRSATAWPAPALCRSEEDAVPGVVVVRHARCDEPTGWRTDDGVGARRPSRYGLTPLPYPAAGPMIRPTVVLFWRGSACRCGG